MEQQAQVIRIVSDTVARVAVKRKSAAKRAMRTAKKETHIAVDE